MNWLWRAIVVRALNWVVDNAELRMYSSPIIVGRLFRSNDIQAIKDAYWVINIRVAGRILLLGCFQVS